MERQQPELKLLHNESSLNQGVLAYWRAKSTDEIVQSLDAREAEALVVKSNGTVMQGNHRIKVLKERNYNVESLPRVSYETLFF